MVFRSVRLSRSSHAGCYISVACLIFSLWFLSLCSRALYLALSSTLVVRFVFYALCVSALVLSLACLLELSGRLSIIFSLFAIAALAWQNLMCLFAIPNRLFFVLRLYSL